MENNSVLWFSIIQSLTWGSEAVKVFFGTEYLPELANKNIGRTIKFEFQVKTVNFFNLSHMLYWTYSKNKVVYLESNLTGYCKFYLAIHSRGTARWPELSEQVRDRLRVNTEILLLPFLAPPSCGLQIPFMHLMSWSPQCAWGYNEAIYMDKFLTVQWKLLCILKT